MGNNLRGFSKVVFTCNTASWQNVVMRPRRIRYVRYAVSSPCVLRIKIDYLLLGRVSRIAHPLIYVRVQRLAWRHGHRCCSYINPVLNEFEMLS